MSKAPKVLNPLSVIVKKVHDLKPYLKNSRTLSSTAAAREISSSTYSAVQAVL